MFGAGGAGGGVRVGRGKRGWVRGGVGVGVGGGVAR